jgi:hypothetical protein
VAHASCRKAAIARIAKFKQDKLSQPCIASRWDDQRLTATEIVRRHPPGVSTIAALAGGSDTANSHK